MPSFWVRTSSWIGCSLARLPTYPDLSNIPPDLKMLCAPYFLSLAKGISVVLDFPGNTKAQRAWFRQLFEGVQAEHELHFVDASDELCKRQLKHRSKDLPPGTAWTTEAEFEAITAYFQPPSNEEGFNVIHYKRD